jgi:hypothetical protein
MNQNEQDDKEFFDYLKKETDVYNKKILFHQLFSIFYTILFFYFMGVDDYVIPKYITLPVLGLMVVLHLLLFRKYRWYYKVFGYKGDDEDYF